MKIGNIDVAYKLLILAATTIITCIVIGIGFIIANNAKSIGNTTIDKLNSLNKELMESDIEMYDGLVITGSDVVNYTKKQLSNYNSQEIAPYTIIITSNSTTTTHKNNTNLSSLSDFTNSMYCNPLKKFKGSVTKNNNDVILSITFTQQN